MITNTTFAEGVLPLGLGRDIPLTLARLKSMAKSKFISTVESLRAPRYLYHGSAFKQDELKPGYQHTGELVTWDHYESNNYLYASDDKLAATMLGISSAVEKKYKLKKTNICANSKTFHLEFEDGPVSMSQITALKVYVYTLRFDPTIWDPNNNPFNNIEGEYRTRHTVSDIVNREPVDVQDTLADWTIVLL